MPPSTPKHLYEKVDEPIEVRTYSKRGRLVIEEFRWRKRDFAVMEECLITKAKRGQIPIWHFSVMTEFASYKIRLESDTLTWWLEEIYSTGSL